jgi:hypothetical protein
MIREPELNPNMADVDGILYLSGDAYHRLSQSVSDSDCSAVRIQMAGFG